MFLWLSDTFKKFQYLILPLLLICRNTIIFYIYFSFPKLGNYCINSNNLLFRFSIYTILLNGRHWCPCSSGFWTWSNYSTSFAGPPAYRWTIVDFSASIATWVKFCSKSPLVYISVFLSSWFCFSGGSWLIQKQVLPQSLQIRVQPSPHVDDSLGRSWAEKRFKPPQISAIQNYEIIHGCCFEQLSLW